MLTSLSTKKLRTMKKLLFVLIALTFSNVSEAQKSERKEVSPEIRAKKHVERISDSIEITNAQKESLKGIFIEYYTEVKAIRSKEEKTKEDKAEFKKAKEVRDQKVKTVLANDEKYAKYVSMSKPNRNKKGQWANKEKFNTPESASKMAEFKVKRISDSIELTKVQQDSLKVIFSEKHLLKAHYRSIENKTDKDKAAFKTQMKSLEKRVEKTFGDKAKYEKYVSMNKENSRKGKGHKKGHKKGESIGNKHKKDSPKREKSVPQK